MPFTIKNIIKKIKNTIESIIKNITKGIKKRHVNCDNEIKNTQTLGIEKNTLLVPYLGKNVLKPQNNMKKETKNIAKNIVKNGIKKTENKF